MYIDIKILTHILAPHYGEDHVLISIDAKIASGNTQLFRIQQYLTNFSILPGPDLNMSLPCVSSAYTLLTVLCSIHGGLLVFALSVFSNELKEIPRQIGGLFLFLPVLVSLCLHDSQLTQPSPGLNSKDPWKLGKWQPHISWGSTALPALANVWKQLFYLFSPGSYFFYSDMFRFLARDFEGGLTMTVERIHENLVTGSFRRQKERSFSS